MNRIRKAETKDLPGIREIYGIARTFMREHGNSEQWGKDDSPEVFLEDDIEHGNLYVLEDDRIHAVFFFCTGEDPIYKVIRDGQWISEEKYGVVHRVASDGILRNVLGQIMDYCKQQIPHLRIDTHEKNKIMQHVIKKNGFVKCGTIYIENGSPRIAYEWVKK